MRPVLSTAASLILVSAFAAPAGARIQPSGLLDQHQEVVEPIAAASPLSSYLAQTFTAGTSGALDTVELSLCLDLPPYYTDTASVRIESVANGIPTGTVLASGAPVILDSASCRWVPFAFSSPAQVIAGTPYAIVMLAPTPHWGLSPEASGDLYPRGQALSNGFVYSDPSDFAFRTYVRPTGNSFVTSLIDSLAGLDTATSFSVFGSGGQSIGTSQLVGPRLTLSQRTLVTNIGAYVMNCSAIIGGQPLCPDRKPFVVQIRPALDGVPHPDVVLATFELSDDGDPLLVSFESASMNLMLPAGTYFALFSPQQPQDSGFLMNSAQDPFEYRSDLVPLGVVAESGTYVVENYAAVRILGLVLPPFAPTSTPVPTPTPLPTPTQVE
jgi:hypothetical protein